MRISWLTADEIAAARDVLGAGGKQWGDHFEPEFVAPLGVDAGIAEHVARAERVSEVVREAGLAEARAKFGDTQSAIEAATVAAAAHEAEELTFDDVLGVFARPVDPYVFYAPFLELLVSLGRGDPRVVSTYERFVDEYAATLAAVPQASARINAVRDGLADFYVSAGRLDDAQALFERRHDEDQNDVAVALSASRAFLAAGSVSHAVRWLGMGAARAAGLGRDDLATKLRDKQDAVRKRLS